MRHAHWILLTGTALMASIAQAAPNWKYIISDIEVVDLGTMGGAESAANDINDQGEIVGWSETEDGWYHGFLWRNGGMEDITPFEGYIADAHGINNHTQVVGYLRHLASERRHGFHWDVRSTVNLLDEAYTDVSDYGICASASDAKAINDSGVITGVRFGGCYPPEATVARAARWTSWSAPYQQIVPMGPGPKLNHAYNINSAGAIVGWDEDGDCFTCGFRWSPGDHDEVPFPPTIAPARVQPLTVKARGINDHGAVVGTLTLLDSPKPDESVTRAFYWNGNATQSSLLPTLSDAGPTAAFEINNQGFSVGYSVNRSRYAVVWHPHIGVHSLPMPPGGVRECQALAVNNRNSSGLVQAVGYCKVGGEEGDRHAVLWNITTEKVTIPQQSP